MSSVAAPRLPVGTCIEEYDFDLPADRIAQHPVDPRDSSRLMVVDRAVGRWEHHRFSELPELLQPGDLVVRNDSRVFCARVRGTREGGGSVEVLLAERESVTEAGETWLCLGRPARRLRAGARLQFPGGLEGRWVESPDEDELRRIVLTGPRPVRDILEDFGEVPLPPYIRRLPEFSDRERYQTVYARDSGSIAAPTAGLHFSSDVFRRLEDSGIEVCSLTLHVGPGTFLPVRTSTVEEHRMLSELVEIPAATAAAVRQARREGRRVLAVGTTTVRALEGLLGENAEGPVRGRTALFIHSGYRFRIVDGMITNFHLPRSTLLMLVAAFAGRSLLLRAYGEAVTAGYRFYSYGDAMLVV